MYTHSKLRLSAGIDLVSTCWDGRIAHSCGSVVHLLDGE